MSVEDFVPLLLFHFFLDFQIEAFLEYFIFDLLSLKLNVFLNMTMNHLDQFMKNYRRVHILVNVENVLKCGILVNRILYIFWGFLNFLLNLLLNLLFDLFNLFIVFILLSGCNLWIDDLILVIVLFLHFIHLFAFSLLFLGLHQVLVIILFTIFFELLNFLTYLHTTHYLLFHVNVIFFWQI